MRIPRSDIPSKTHALPEIAFEEQRLTSFAGIAIFQKLFQALRIFDRLRDCCRHLDDGAAYGCGRVLQVLTIHLLLGFRQLRDVDFYRKDPLVCHVASMRSLPSVSTISRGLNSCDKRSVENMAELISTLTLDRLAASRPYRVTLDFDGSVQSTKRHAQGTAVGYCKKKKGLRSYYPLFCTIAQIGQVLAVLHRPGNVHDSNGASDFIYACILAARQVLPHAIIEVRMDSAFFDDQIVERIEALDVEYTVSVPFQRFAELKDFIARRRFWWPTAGGSSFFEKFWKPQCWVKARRFLFIRARVPQQIKGPLQLDLFEPTQFGFDFKVVLTNKSVSARKVVRFHEGRGSQEGVFAQLKDQAQMDYVPVRSLAGNQMYLLSSILAHNIARELQMQADPMARGTTEKRSPCWIFKSLRSLQNTLIRIAGRITRPHGKLTLTLNANPTVQKAFLHYISV